MTRLIMAFVALTAFYGTAFAGEELTARVTVGGHDVYITQVMDDEKPAPTRYRINTTEADVLAEAGKNRLTLQQAFVDYSDTLKRQGITQNFKAMRNPRIIRGKIVAERDDQLNGSARKIIRLDSIAAEFALTWDIHDFDSTEVGTSITLKYLHFTDGSTFVLDVL